MSKTPEGLVKDEIKRILKLYNAHYDMPVNYGFGKKGVDFHCAVRSPVGALAFYIEAKRPNKDPTALQSAFLRERREEQGAITFEIDGKEGLMQLTTWLERIRMWMIQYGANPDEHTRSAEG